MPREENKAQRRRRPEPGLERRPSIYRQEGPHPVLCFCVTRVSEKANPSADIFTWNFFLFLGLREVSFRDNRRRLIPGQ